MNQYKILRVLRLIGLLQQSPSKSVHQLAQLLDNTERTVYRYLELIRELGFEVQRDHFKRFCIVSGELGQVTFTTEEATLLNELIHTVAVDSPLRDGLLKKVYLSSEIPVAGKHVLKAHVGTIIQNLSEAIALGKQVRLKKYHSLNSERISDRILEPFAFTENYRSLLAYELSSGKNKFFNVGRITGVEVMEQGWKHAAQHQQASPDAFGFGPSERSFPIHLVFSLRACILLKEEFPMCAPYIKSKFKSNLFELKMSVNNLKPVQRFVDGLKGEFWEVNM
jgi:proteasome accessory factor C